MPSAICLEIPAEEGWKGDTSLEGKTEVQPAVGSFVVYESSCVPLNMTLSRKSSVPWAGGSSSFLLRGNGLWRVARD